MNTTHQFGPEDLVALVRYPTAAFLVLYVDPVTTTVLSGQKLVDFPTRALRKLR